MNGARLLPAALLLPAAAAAAAQPGIDNALDGVVETFRAAAGGWEEVLAAHAARLFWTLATIEMSWAALQLAFRGADAEEWAGALVNQVLFIGFFWMLLLNAPEWSRLIAASFGGVAGSLAGDGAAMQPSRVLEAGVRLGWLMAGEVDLFRLASYLLPLAALAVVVCFALIAALMAMVLVEMYLVLTVGVLLMGFGGSRFTKDHAVRMLLYAAGVGARFAMLHIVVALGVGAVTDLTGALAMDSLGEVFVAVAVPVVLLALAWSVPAAVERMFAAGGAAGQALTAAARTVAASAAAGAVLARGAAVQTAGAAAAGRDAAAAARAAHPGAGAGTVAAAAAGALARAAGGELVRRGSLGGRLREHLRGERGKAGGGSA